MNTDYLKESVVSLKAKYGYMLFANIFLLIVVFVLASILASKDTQIILVDRKDTSNRLHLTSNGNFADDYVSDWAYSIVRDFFSINPANAQREAMKLLRITNTNYSDLKARLLKSVEQHKKYNISTSFYPKNYVIDHSGNFILVTGLHITNFGKTQKSKSMTKTFKLEWERGVNNIIMLKNLTEVKPEENAGASKSNLFGVNG